MDRLSHNVWSLWYLPKSIRYRPGRRHQPAINCDLVHVGECAILRADYRGNVLLRMYWDFGTCFLMLFFTTFQNPTSLENLLGATTESVSSNDGDSRDLGPGLAQAGSLASVTSSMYFRFTPSITPDIERSVYVWMHEYH